MADLNLIGIIDQTIEKAGLSKRPRRYLGMSDAGDECSRRLWIKFHTDYRPELSGRVLRLFETGNIIERRVVRDLKKAGFKVSGRQLKFKDFGGKFKGHCDGIVEGLEESSPHILEVKSASSRNYRDFIKHGIAAHEKYHAQVNLYMHYAGLDRALFILENKDNSERYQERVKLDKGLVELLRAKAKAIIEAKSPPSAPWGVDWFKCRMCNMNVDKWCRKEWGSASPF